MISRNDIALATIQLSHSASNPRWLLYGRRVSIGHARSKPVERAEKSSPGARRLERVLAASLDNIQPLTIEVVAIYQILARNAEVEPSIGWELPIFLRLGIEYQRTVII